MDKIFFKTLLAFCILSQVITVNAQYFNTGQDPFSTKWRQINTDNFQVIYPEDHEKNGQDLARKLEAVYDYLTYSLQSNPRKISVILHSSSTYSNGLNGWAPRRIEIWPLADQETYGQDWIEQLAIHELRHTVQVEKMNQGFGKILSLIYGEQSQALTIGLFVPFWFLEGDAVVAETALSNSGRGRVPAFTQQLRALVLEKGITNYDKLILGSYKTFIPNHYVVGYHAVAINRLYNGAGYYDNKLNEVARYSAWKKLFTKKRNDLRDRSRIKHIGFAIEKLDSLWREAGLLINPYQSEELLPHVKGYFSYTDPVALGDTIWAIEESLGDIPSLVAVSKNEILKKVAIGNYAEDNFGANRKYMVWSERIPDIRWQHRSSNDIILYNINDGDKSRITFNQRLFHPDINNNDEIVAVEVLEDRTSKIVVLSKSGTRLRTLVAGGDNLLLQPSWSSSGDKVVYLELTPNGKALKEWSKEGITIIRPAAHREIGHPVYGDNHIYYTVADSGMNTIHSYSLIDKSDKIVINAEFGVDFPSYDFRERKLVYSEYSSDGYKLSAISVDSLYIVSNLIKSPLPVELPEVLSGQEKGVVDFKENQDIVYKSTKYSKWNLVNIHSWFPFYLSPGSQEQRFPGVYLMSQNKLSNTTIYAGYNGDSRSKDERFTAGITFEMFWPEINLEYTAGINEQAFNTDYEYSFLAEAYAVRTTKVTPSVEKLSGSVSLPINIGRRQWSRRIIPYISFEHEYYEGYNLEVSSLRTVNPRYETLSFENKSFSSLTGGMILYNYRHRSSRDLFPEIGQRLSLLYKKDVGSSYNFGSLYGGRLTLYWPGILKSHHLISEVGLQRRKIDEMGYSFSNLLDFPRGEASFLTEELKTVNLDYYMPVVYPDLNVGWLAYAKRLGLSGFYDYASASYNGLTSILWSSGVSVWGDFYFLRYELPVRLEYRIGYSDFSSSRFNELSVAVSLY